MMDTTIKRPPAVVLVLILSINMLSFASAWNNSILRGRVAASLKSTITPPRAQLVRRMAGNSDTATDEYGRRIRSRGSSGGGSGWDDFDPFQENQGKQRSSKPSSGRSNKGGWDDDDSYNSSPSRSGSGGSGWDDFDSNPPQKARSSGGGGGWDDFDPFGEGSRRSRGSGGGGGGERQKRKGGAANRNNNPQGRGSNSSRDKWRSDGRNNNNNNYNEKKRRSKKDGEETKQRKVNMRALEGAGFVHLYGIASCLNALQADRRDFTRPEEMIDLDQLQGEDFQHELQQRERKPEAQFSPNLFTQENSQRRTTRSTDKVMATEKIEALAKERGIPIHKVDKGVLNTLSGNRPHQGFVLRCGKLDWVPISELPLEEKKLWLCLDEVVDPQNLGALIRSAYFLSGSDDDSGIGIVVCGKNSAPPSPVVSAASAGALEVADMYSTSNLPKLLSKAKQDGFRIVGASSSIPQQTQSSWIDADDKVIPNLYELQNLSPTNNDAPPTILVLGSEGHGLRTLVAKACTEFVRIPGGNTQESDTGIGVDSLNVSVTGGILLWHLLHGK